MTPAEQARDLLIAKAMAAAGIPIFVAAPCAGPSCSPECLQRTKGAGNASGFHLPPRWEPTKADPQAVDQWRPGWALCAVGGLTCDFLDTDPPQRWCEIP